MLINSLFHKKILNMQALSEHGIFLQISPVTAWVKLVFLFSNNSIMILKIPLLDID